MKLSLDVEIQPSCCRSVSITHMGVSLSFVVDVALVGARHKYIVMFLSSNMDENPFLAECPAGVAWITNKGCDIHQKPTARMADDSICFCVATLSSPRASLFLYQP